VLLFIIMGDDPSSRANGHSRQGEAISRIGVVDDDDAIRDALSSLLRSAGYACAGYASAEAFLSSGRIGEIDCMVLDIQMPGLSGLDLQSRLRQTNCPIPIIFVTGRPDYYLRKRALDQGAVALLDKPFKDDDLLGAIRTALDIGQ
jgi:FixJ family two-component response regulator